MWAAQEQERRNLVAPRVVNVLCIRDPDWENEYVSDAAQQNVVMNEITIDIGGQWLGYKDFASCLVNGDDYALDYERGMLEEIADLPADNPVREGVEEFFENARRDGA
jgi:hypothetical protein